MTLTHVPAMQERLAAKTASAIEKKLGTKVSIGRIDLGFLNRIIIDDVTIQDQKKKEMLRIGRLSVKLNWTDLLGGRISISSAQLFGAHANAYKPHADAPVNFQFVLDSLASKDTLSQTPINLRINSFILRHSSVSYQQTDAPQKKSFDTKHLKINDISAHIILKTLTDDSLSINVKRIAFKEHSGLDLNHLSFRLTFGSQTALLSDFSLQLPHSRLTTDSVLATYDKNRWKETLRFKANKTALSLSPADLSCIIPAFSDYTETIALQTTAVGTYDSITIPSLEVHSTNRLINLSAKGSVNGLNRKNPAWQAEVKEFSLSGKAIRTLQSELKGIPTFVNNLGMLNLNGRFGQDENGVFTCQSKLNSDIGQLSLKFQMRDDSSFHGSLNTNGIDLQKLFDDKQFGLFATNVDISGNQKKLTAKGHVTKFDYRGYAYQNILIDGSFLSDDLLHGYRHQFTANGKLSINDENIRVNTSGKLTKSGKSTTIQLTGMLNNLSPKALHLSDQWGEASFAATFAANISASNINDAKGGVLLNDFRMTDTTDVFRIQSVILQSGYEEEKHFLHLNGDMGSIELTGEFDWDTLPQSFINAIASKLPTLPGLPPKTNKQVTNDFAININLHSTEWLQRLFNIPLHLDKSLQLKASINDLNHDFSAKGNIPAFSYNGAIYKNATINMSSPEDSIKCAINVFKHTDNGQYMNLTLSANASDNQIRTNFTWNNHEKSTDYMQGKLNTITQLYSDDQRRAEAHIHFEPSHFTIGNKTWNIIPSDIFYSDKDLTVERFALEHEQQHLIIDGTATESADDTLTIDLNGVDVGYVLDLVNFHSVEFDGKATGRAYVTQLFGTPAAWADLIVDEFRFENGRMGTLQAKAVWNNEASQIDIDARSDDGPDIYTLINGYVSPARDSIDLRIKGHGTYADFLQTYTKSILRNVTGNAYGELQLVGPLGEMDLLGRLVVDGHAEVISLGTTYWLKKDTVDFVHNDILLNQATIYDRYDQSASVTGGIHHENLSKLTFDLDIETPGLLAYDFKDYGDEIFCGTVYAEGHVDMHGRPGEVTINCDVTPLKPTIFFYNAASNGSVSSQEFITWRNKREIAGNKNTTGQNIYDEPHSDIPSDLYINFLINTTPESTMRLLMDEKTNDYITLNGSGVMRASYHNKGAFHLFGTYTIQDGTYGITIQSLFKKNFHFKEGGTITFSGNPMDAALRLQAVHTVNGVSLSDLNIGNSFSNNTVRVNCLMNIQGQASAPRVDFDLDMPNVNNEEKQMIRSIITNEQEMNQQVLYLLGIGRFYTQGINNASSQEYGQTQLAMQSFLSGTLSTQINEVISQVIKNDDWNFGANISTGNEGWHNAEYEGIISGKMLNNRLLINGQFGYRDNATQATPSFIGDFDIRYLLQPNGNLALKVYNQTNDRYFTRSSLNTQGIGIIIKRDFNGLRDLFTSRRKIVLETKNDGGEKEENKR